MRFIDSGGGQDLPDDAIFITFAQWLWSSSRGSSLRRGPPEFDLSLGSAMRSGSAALRLLLLWGGVVLLAADLIVATIQVSRDYVSAAALRADNLSLLQLIWQHVNESCLKLKANINSHLAKGSECPQSQCIKWFDWQSRERRNNKINCFFKKTAVVLVWYETSSDDAAAAAADDLTSSDNNDVSRQRDTRKEAEIFRVTFKQIRLCKNDK